MVWLGRLLLPCQTHIFFQPERLDFPLNPGTLRALSHDDQERIQAVSQTVHRLEQCEVILFPRQPSDDQDYFSVRSDLQSSAHRSGRLRHARFHTPIRTDRIMNDFDPLGPHTLPLELAPEWTANREHFDGGTQRPTIKLVI